MHVGGRHALRDPAGREAGALLPRMLITFKHDPKCVGQLARTQQKTLTWQPQNGHPLLLIQLHKVLDGAGVARLNVQRHLGEQTTHNDANGAWRPLLVSAKNMLVVTMAKNCAAKDTRGIAAVE